MRSRELPACQSYDTACNHTRLMRWNVASVIAEFTYLPGDWLLFGAETSGLPLEAHEHINVSGGELVKIPLVQDHVRSLNLAVSVGVGVFEAIRQLDEGQHYVEPRDDSQLRLPTPFVLQQQQPGGNTAGATIGTMPR